MAWLQISVEVAGDQVEMVSEAFNIIGALSVTVLDAGDESLLEPAPGASPLWSNTRVIALFEAEQDIAELKQQLQAVLGAPVPDLLVEPLANRDWSNTWRDNFGAMRDAELDKALAAIAQGQSAEQVLRQLAHGLTNKFLHAPSTRLKKAGEQGDSNYIRWTHDLFDLPIVDETSALDTLIENAASVGGLTTKTTIKDEP